jgi:hypothetical protein
VSPEKVEGDPQKKKAIELQNQSGVILTQHGVNVKRLPNQNDPEGNPSPDLKINDPTPTIGAKGKPLRLISGKRPTSNLRKATMTVR